MWMCGGSGKDSRSDVMAGIGGGGGWSRSSAQIQLTVVFAGKKFPCSPGVEWIAVFDIVDKQFRIAESGEEDLKSPRGSCCWRGLWRYRRDRYLFK